ncbi:MAG TPA: methyltransferase domain-containing protein [Baekduia sp.]|nr:methyltransferase domain-containing protein [Baekduia sp.]
MSDYTAIYDPDTDFDARYTRATARRIATYVRPGDRVLEPGCATGLMTAELAAAGAQVVALDRSAPYLERLAARGLAAVDARLADLDADPLPAGPFDHVVATNLLHELADPGAFLARTAAVLAPHGLVHVSVPNPASLHRLVALDMGWIDDLEAISERGSQFATRRMLGVEDVRVLAAGAGLRVVHKEGVVCKPLPNAQMAELPEAVLEGLERVAHRVPDLCAMSLFTLHHA